MQANDLGFFAKLDKAIERNDSLLCLGLDPEGSKIITGLPFDKENLDWLYSWCMQMIEKTRDAICCVKPNSAFFEQFGASGVDVLQKIIHEIKNELPILLDVKRGDIGSSASAYAKSAFEVLQADAVTLNPYLGRDGVDPFLAYPGKSVFVLCKTSNPSAEEIQDHGIDPLYQHVARTALSWGGLNQIGLVVGATKSRAIREIREIAPENWLLVPGVGVQGGDLETALQIGLRSDGKGLIIPVSRTILYAEDPRKATLELKRQINDSVKKWINEPIGTPDENTQLVVEMFNADCIQFGDFTLASGKKSPLYIDLRRVISYPALMNLVVGACIKRMKKIPFDVLAAVPFAALPLGANIALSFKKSMIYPRKEVKTHGTGKMVEGNFKTGQRTLLIEDVITTGGSVMSAVETLHKEGLVMQDVLVLVDRQQGGSEALMKNGITLHAVLSIHRIMEILLKEKCINQAVYGSVMKYLDEDRES